MKARVVPDSWGGWEVQVWKWWWPFWRQPFTNTYVKKEDAIKLAESLVSDDFEIKRKPS